MVTYYWRLAKWKIVLLLLPFIFPLNQIFVAIDLQNNMFPVGVDLFLDYPITFLRIVEISISQPFEQILQTLGWWSNNGIFVAPDGPLLPGSFFVAIVYSIVIYILASLFSAWRGKRISHT